MRHLPVLVVASALIGCADLTPPSAPAPETPGPVVTVGQASYRWSRDSVIAVTARNPLDAPVYYSCGPFALQRYRNGWRDVPLLYDWIDCPMRRLPASDSLGHTLPLTNDVIPQSGWYRVVFYALP